MKPTSPAFLQYYKSVLRAHLAQRSRPDFEVIGKIGDQARSNGLPISEFAKLHERFLVMDLLPGYPAGQQTSLIRKAGIFFAAVIVADAAGKAGPRDVALFSKTIESLSGRVVELSAANRQLGLDILQGKKTETTLRKSEKLGLKALVKCETCKKQLRGLSRQILSTQAEERKKISGELHDVVAQALMGITIRLSTIRREAAIHTEELDRSISLTQKMITQSADTIHQYARQLHPTVLDDLGLIPALHSFMKCFTTHTGIQAHLTVLEGVEKLEAVKRSILYRVVQDTLTAVACGASASHVEVSIRKEAKFVCMEVSDDGRSLQTQPALSASGTNSLGLLGMRERVEMVGGSFEIESEPGKNTKMTVRIPVSKITERKWR